MDTREVIERYKIICICRRIYGEELYRLAEAMAQGGIRLMEVTFDQSDPDGMEKTCRSIRLLRDRLGDRMKVGAGTVLTAEQVEAACSAGASYILSPNTDRDVIRKTRDCGLISIPGAMTPTEILTAHGAGADFVKLFPLVSLGESYLRDIRSPISHVKLIGAGGLNEENLCRYMDIGLTGAGISGRLTDKTLRERGDYAALSDRARIFMRLVGAGE